MAIMPGKVTVAPLAAMVLMKPPARPQPISSSRIQGSMGTARRRLPR
jgi:hypothetical protein